MRTFLNLFGRSPFLPLQAHMDIVAQCVHMLPEFFDRLYSGDFQKVEELAIEISDLEHQADVTKDDIRSHLPKSLFLPIDRGQLLEILSIQDHIANSAEEIAVTATLKQVKIPELFKADFDLFLRKNIECFDGARKIIREMHELLESSFGGKEAEKVRAMVNDVAYKEHETDLIHRRLLKSLFASETEMSFAVFTLWERIFAAFASIAHLSENLANRVCMTLELK